MVMLTGLHFPQFSKFSLKHHSGKKGFPISFKITELFFSITFSSFCSILPYQVKLRNSYSQLANEVIDQKANSAVLLNKCDFLWAQDPCLLGPNHPRAFEREA